MMDVGTAVETTGKGRSRRFKKWRGVIAACGADDTGNNFYIIRFNNPDIKPTLLYEIDVRPQIHVGCPCAICTWEFEHHQ